jgi:hypothetical protein
MTSRAFPPKPGLSLVASSCHVNFWIDILIPDERGDAPLRWLTHDAPPATGCVVASPGPLLLATGPGRLDRGGLVGLVLVLGLNLLLLLDDGLRLERAVDLLRDERAVIPFKPFHFFGKGKPFLRN